MKKIMKNSMVLLGLCLSATHSNAQLGGMLRDLQGLADRAKQAQQPQAQQPQQSQTKSKINPDGSLSLAKTDFLRDWCKSTDTLTLSAFDYRGVKTGDLCAQPQEVINKLFIGDIIVINNEGPSEFTAQDMESKNFTILNVSTIVDPIGKKIYISSFQGAICKTDSSNSLQPDNNFRNALESKYGKPNNHVTTYDVLKPQQEALKKQADMSRANAVSVLEAKKARDFQTQADAIGNMLKNPHLKTEIAQLEWLYKDSQKRTDAYPGMIVWQPTAPTERRLCTNDLSGQFNFAINANGAMVSKINELTEVAARIIKNKQRNAPTPKF